MPLAVAIFVPAELVNVQLAPARPPASTGPLLGRMLVSGETLQLTVPPVTPRKFASTARTRIESAVESWGDKAESAVWTRPTAEPTGKNGVSWNGVNLTGLWSRAARPMLSWPANPESSPATSPHQFPIAFTVSDAWMIQPR